MKLPALLKLNDGRWVENGEDWRVRRQEILDILRREEYGYSPQAPERVKGTVRAVDKKCCSGHARLESIDISFAADKGEVSFPIKLFIPENGKKNPLFLLLNFRPDAYDMYFPAEEILDNGFALAVVYYQDITSDNGDFTDKLAGMYRRKYDGTDWGKISMWAWGASRVLDYLLTRSEVNFENVAVIGHSRLGKTALWCAAQDERFRFAFSNDSGCAGAALERIKHENAETIESITRVLPYWFCENYHRYAKNVESMPFDQHFLLGAIAPRFLCVGSASLDAWADPYSEQLCCCEASPAWEVNGHMGFVGPKESAHIGDSFHEGNIGYHLRDGIHFLGRTDWLQYMAFMKKKINKK